MRRWKKIATASLLLNSVLYLVMYSTTKVPADITPTAAPKIAFLQTHYIGRYDLLGPFPKASKVSVSKARADS